MLSASESRADILFALEAGAHGYLTTRLGVAESRQAIVTVLSGAIYVPSSFAGGSKGEDLLGGAAASAPMPALGFTSKLTKRQFDVFRMLAEGKSNKEIARELAVAEGTVKIHVTGILRRMGVSNRAAAAVVASRLLAGQSIA